MNETLAAFPDLEMTKIIPDIGVKNPNTDSDMTYLKKKNTYKAIYQKLSK